MATTKAKAPAAPTNVPTIPAKTAAAPANQHLAEPLVRQLKEFIAALPEKDCELINVLHKAQEIFGYLPRSVQALVAEEMGVSLARVYGIVTFYTFFTMEPRGRHPISVCLGTACFVKGGSRVLSALKDLLHVEVGEVTADGRFSVNTVRCVGGCALAPVVMIGDQVFGHVTPAQLPGILAGFQDGQAAEGHE